MPRTAARALTVATVTLVLLAGAQPAHAATSVGADKPSGFLCKLLKINCP
jgi:hypothetical protein